MPASYKFISEPDDNLKCLICYEVPTSGAVWHEACGKLFCDACILKYGNNKPCPNCRRRNPTFTPDNNRKKTIGALQVHCEAAGKCEWEGRLDAFTAHETTCQYTVLPCPNSCKDEKGVVRHYFRKYLPQHQAECPYRSIACTLCGTKTPHIDVQDHEKVCPKKVVYCSNPDCTMTMAREKLQEHVARECQHTILPCKYASVGCGIKRKRLYLAEHESEIGMHLDKAVEITAELREKVAKIEQDTEQRLAKLETKVPANFVFKITSFTWKKEGDRCYTSQSFYTSDPGYNLAIQVYMNGWEKHKGKSLSVFVSVQKGRHDSNLSWPFKGIVTITLLNQLEDRNHFSRKIHMAEAKGYKTWGYPAFILQDDLIVDPQSSACYLKDDTLYFKVSVESKDDKAWLHPPTVPKSADCSPPTIHYHNYYN